MAEYTETVRFQNGHPGIMPGPLEIASKVKLKKCPRRMSGMTWMFFGLLLFFVAAAAFTAIVTPLRHASHIQFTAPAPPRSYVGVNGFDTTDGGVMFDFVEAPGTPADRAGLVGGDVITTFDGQTVHTDDEMNALLSRTPIGKTVDVVFLRDGEPKTTKLTTVSKEEYDRLMKIFNNRSEGKGQFGYDDGETERVAIEGTKTFGVRVDSISQSRPADLAGIKNGDIIVEFDGIPIRTPQELRARIRRAIPYTTVDVTIMRRNERIVIPVKMGKQ